MAAADNCIVIDYGTETIKAGLASSFPTDECPPHVVPTVVQAVPGAPGTSTPSYSCPVQHGEIVDFDKFEALLHHIVYGLLGWTYENEGTMVISEPLFTPKADREQLTQILFEQFNIDGLFVYDSAVLSLYAVGKFSGLVVDLGHGKTDIAAVLDGATNTAATRRYPVSGQDLNRHLLALLQQKGLALQDPRNVRALKHLCCRAAECPADYEAAAPAPEPQTYTLPDGQQITLDTQGLQLADLLFNPQLASSPPSGAPLEAPAGPTIADLATECVLMYYEGMGRKTVYENILLCGGGSSIPGLQQRFVREMKMLSPLGSAPAVCGVAEYLPAGTQRHAAWAGGAVMARVVQQQNQFMSKGDYEEAGPASVHRRCA